MVIQPKSFIAFNNQYICVATRFLELIILLPSTFIKRFLQKSVTFFCAYTVLGKPLCPFSGFFTDFALLRMQKAPQPPLP